ncbi:MAG: hypothetical protein WCI43_05850, partial [Candidatus Firestonebacteria bacterium]
MHRKTISTYAVLAVLTLALLSCEAFSSTTVVTINNAGLPNNAPPFGISGPRKFERTPNGNLCALYYRSNSSSTGYTEFIFSADNGVTWSDEIHLGYISYPFDYRQNSCMTYDSSNNCYAITQVLDQDSGHSFLRFTKLKWTGSSYYVERIYHLQTNYDGTVTGSDPNSWKKSIVVDKDGVIWVFATINADSLSQYYPYFLAIWKSTDGGATWTFDTSCRVASTTLSGAVDATATSFTIASATGFKASCSFVNIGGEWATFGKVVTTTGPTMATVRRGKLSPTTATSALTTLPTDTIIKAGNGIDLATTRFSSSGKLNLEGEKINYTGIVGNWFTGCTRGLSIMSSLTVLNAIAANATAVTLSGDALQAGYENDGIIRIDNELMTYNIPQIDNGDGLRFPSLTRGLFAGMVYTGSSGTTITCSAAVPHSAGAVIYQGEATPHGAKAKINVPLRVGHAAGETVFQLPYIYVTQYIESTLYNGYPFLIYVDGAAVAVLKYMYFNGTSWSAPATFWTGSSLGLRHVTGAYVISPVSTESGELNVAIWNKTDSTLKQFSYSGTTIVSTRISTDTTYLTNSFIDVGLTTNGKDLNCFYVKTNAANQYVICSKLGTKSGGLWSWGTETTIATDTATSILSHHGMDTVTNSGKTGYFPVFWSEGHSSPYYIKLEKQQTPLMVNSISPSSVTNTSQPAISISGLGFYNTNGANKIYNLKLSNEVSFSSWSVTDDLTIQNAVLPVGVTPGTYNIVATDTSGTSATCSSVLTVTGISYSAPTVTDLSPFVGYNVSPSTMTVKGTNFMGGVGSAGFTSRVYLSGGGNTYNLTGWTVASETSINGGVLPSGLPLGFYDVLVTTGAGTTPVSGIQLEIQAGPDVTA